MKIDLSKIELIIYHNSGKSFPCPDGLCAAWIVYNKMIDLNIDVDKIDFIGWMYSQNDDKEYPDLKKYKNVLVLDFSFPVDFLDDCQDKNINIFIIDHHQGFTERLAKSKSYNLSNLLFNESECGATLTWKYFYPGLDVPKFIQYIKDRDLFTKLLPNSDAFHAGMGVKRRTFDLYNHLHQLEKIDFNLVLDYLLPDGFKSLAKKQIKIDKYIEKLEFIDDIPLVLMNKSDIFLRSDVAEQVLLKYNESPFCVILQKKTCEHIRVRSCNKTIYTDTLKLFADSGASGHRPASSFKWNGTFTELVYYIKQKSKIAKDYIIQV